MQTSAATACPPVAKGKLSAYLFNLIWVTVLLNLVLFPAIAWVFYHGKEIVDGAVVATEIFFGGIVCTLIVGVTGHFEAAQKIGGCLACKLKGHCPFLGIFLSGIGFGIFCVTLSHLYLGNDPVPFAKLLWIKGVQGVFLGVAIPLLLVKTRLLLHPEVDHAIH